MATTQLAEHLARSVLGIAVEAGLAGARTVDRHVRPVARTAVSAADEALTAVLQRVAAAALARVDATALVREHVDLDALVATVDVDAVVDRVDLLARAAFVIDGIDLPAIIRESTGGITSDALRGARVRSYEADQTVARVVDRMLLRHRARETQALNGAP